MKDPTIRHWFKDFHHHDKGPCDLDVYLATLDWSAAHCHRQLWHGPNTCGCEMCSGQSTRRRTRRQVRHRWQRKQRELLKATSLDDVDDIDGASTIRTVDKYKWAW